MSLLAASHLVSDCNLCIFVTLILCLVSPSLHEQVGDCPSLYFLYMCVYLVVPQMYSDHHYPFCPVKAMVSVYLLFWLIDSLDDGAFLYEMGFLASFASWSSACSLQVQLAGILWRVTLCVVWIDIFSTYLGNFNSFVVCNSFQDRTYICWKTAAVTVAASHRCLYKASMSVL